MREPGQRDVEKRANVDGNSRGILAMGMVLTFVKRCVGSGSGSYLVLSDDVAIFF